MKALLPLALLALPGGTAPAAFPQPKVPTAIVQMGCRQGECQWAQLTAIATVRSSAAWALRKVTTRTGRSLYDYPHVPTRYTPKVRIAWDKQPGTDYVLCSKKRPALIFWDTDEKTWIAALLGLSNLGGYEYSAANEYMLVCHKVMPGKWSEKGIPRMGYARVTGEEPRIKRPEDVLAYLR